MTRRKASFLQGTTAAPYLLPAEDHRLNHAGLWAPSSLPGAAALAVQNGIVWGPGNPGAVTVVAGGVNINPFHAIVQGSRSGVQGVFELTSDAVEFRAITAASSTQYRKGRLGIRVYDQGAGAAKDDWDIEVLYGAAAATAGAATLPPLPLDSTWFELRTFDVSNTGAITLSGTTPRTTGRGGILPVEAGDVTPGAVAGQYRDHPTNGLERWTGIAWERVRPGSWVNIDSDGAYQWTLPTAWGAAPASGNGPMTASPVVPAGRTLDVEVQIPRVIVPATSGVQFRLLVGGVQRDAIDYSAGAGVTVYVPGRLGGSAEGAGAAVPIVLEGKYAVAQAYANTAAGLGPVRIRYRVT